MQTKTQSLVETCLNIGTGFIVSLAVLSWVIVPIWGLQVRGADNLAITGVFTITSVIRSYLWRRFFNWRHG